MSQTTSRPMRVMAIMAHQDDLEFNAGGTFALLRATWGEDVDLHILATTRGASGHHQMGSEETFRRRDAEARSSAELIGAGYACMTGLDGHHLPGQVFIDRNTLGGLWNAIRAYEPDVIFAPPVAGDPLAGVHIDHQNTALALRMVAYQLVVPGAYPTLGGPVKQRVRSPLIINVDDGYSAEAGFHIRQDISGAYQTKVAMSLCHESQIFEWLPFSRGADRPLTRDEWIEHFRVRHVGVNQRYGQGDPEVPSEYFRITRWGRAPRPGELARLFPAMSIDRYDATGSD